MQDATRPRRTPRTRLSAAAESLAGGTSGRWLRLVSRFGLVSRAVVYILVGYLTVRLLLDSRGRSVDPVSGTEAVQQAAQLPWGEVSLLLLAAGFAGYALTQLVEAVFRPQHAGNRVGAWQQRLVSTWGCLVYAAFCVSTLSLLDAMQEPTGNARAEQRQDTTLSAALLGNGLGRVFLLLVGVVVVVGGVELGRRSVRFTFQERFSAQLSARWGAVVRGLGALGCVARGTVFVLVGVFIVKAAVLGQPRQTKGLTATLRAVAGSAYGSLTLAALAVGMFCYGLYCLLEARYRDLTPGR